MMVLRKLKNLDLHEKMKSLLKNERTLIHEVLLHIVEVDRRKLFLEMAYPSLYEYLVDGIGYSSASAQRRIDAARIMAQVPELGDKIEAGSISLSQLGQVQKAFRQVRKISPSPVTLEEKKKLISKIEDKSFKETELVLAHFFSLPEVYEEKMKIQKDESVRIEMTLSKTELEIIKQAQLLLGHELRKQNLSSQSIKDLLICSSKKIIQQKTKYKDATLSMDSLTKLDNVNTSESIEHSEPLNLSKTFNPLEEPIRKTISMSVKKEILKNQNSCQFISPITGKVCNSKQFLEFDHIKPQWAGGSHNAQNLRLLCSNHNKHRYKMGR